MKKLILIAILLTSASSSYAISPFDNTEGGAPFMLIQQAIMEQQELEDSNAKQKKDDARIRKLKQPTKIDLQKPAFEQEELPESSDIKMIQENGNIILKQTP